jgi:hypothetical protein
VATAAGAEQHGERILGRVERAFEAGDRGLGLRELRERLLHIELAGLAVLELRPRDPQALLLGLHIALRELDALLQRADVEIGARDPGGETHERAVIGCDRGEHRGAIRLDGTAILSPEVELPGGAQAELGRAEDRIRLRQQQRGVALPLVLRATDERLLLREELAHSDIQLRLRLQDARRGNLQGKIVVIGRVDERIERRILENAPPPGRVGGGGRAGCGPGRLGDPVLGYRGGGTREVGPDLAAMQCERCARHRCDA